MVELIVVAALAGCAVQTLRGDVDGDRRAETVTLTRSCRLVVAGATVSLGASARPEDELPRLVRLAPLDDRPGSEIVVDLDAGASARLVGTFTLVRGRLARMWIGTRPVLFAYGGSAGRQYAIDCAGGAIVATTGFSDGPVLKIERRVYEARDGVYALRRVTVSRVSAKTFFSIQRPPFGSCR